MKVHHKATVDKAKKELENTIEDRHQNFMKHTKKMFEIEKGDLMKEI